MVCVLSVVVSVLGGGIDSMCRTDTTGRTWCYTTGWSNTGCGDLQTSKRYTSNPWSYRACTYSG